MICEVDGRANVGIDHKTLTIGFAPFMTKYKRAELIFFDLEVLRKVNQIDKIQLIFGGKAHPSMEMKTRLSRIFLKISKYL